MSERDWDSREGGREEEEEEEEEKEGGEKRKKEVEAHIPTNHQWYRVIYIYLLYHPQMTDDDRVGDPECQKPQET